MAHIGQVESHENWEPMVIKMIDALSVDDLPL